MIRADMRELHPSQPNHPPQPPTITNDLAVPPLPAAADPTIYGSDETFVTLLWNLRSLSGKSDHRFEKVMELTQ